MVEFRRTVKCSSCGKESSIFLSSEMELNEVVIAGKCTQCGNTIQLNYKLEKSERAPEEQPLEQKKPEVQLDESLFEPEIPSEAIKELIEE